MIPETVSATCIDDALAAFDPSRFGFRPYRSGWIKDDPSLGPVVICALGWEHAQSPSYDYEDYDRREIDPLSLVVRLQDRTWGMPPEDLVPVNLLAVIADTGGSILVAYELEKGFNADGWLGFIIGAGGSTGTLVSHMLGVHETIRGARDIGWYLKIVQAHEALRNGHVAMSWTFDPMRGANARLNLEKLGAYVDDLAIDKYGPLRSALYGDVPSDRLLARWELCDPATHRRIAAVTAGTYHPLSPRDLLDVPEVTTENATTLIAQQPPRVCYRIPGDIDVLMRDDPHAAIAWRGDMRAALSGFITTKSRVIGDAENEGPVAVSVRTDQGRYRITGFATAHDDMGERISYYVLDVRS